MIAVAGGGGKNWDSSNTGVYLYAQSDGNAAWCRETARKFHSMLRKNLFVTLQLLRKKRGAAESSRKISLWLKPQTKGVNSAQETKDTTITKTWIAYSNSAWHASKYRAHKHHQSYILCSWKWTEKAGFAIRAVFNRRTHTSLLLAAPRHFHRFHLAHCLCVAILKHTVIL